MTLSPGSIGLVATRLGDGLGALRHHAVFTYRETLIGTERRRSLPLDRVFGRDRSSRHHAVVIGGADLQGDVGFVQIETHALGTVTGWDVTDRQRTCGVLSDADRRSHSRFRALDVRCVFVCVGDELELVIGGLSVGVY